MRVIETGLPGCVVVEPELHADERGHFYEQWNQQRWRAAGLDAGFVQSNVSVSGRGVLRGLHYQWPQPQGKLVSVLHGEIFDVAVDIRRGSPHYGRWTAAMLTAGNRRSLWVPEGFAHGFACLADDTVVHYLCTRHYLREADAALRWDDADLAIDWPLGQPRLSGRDARAPFLKEVDPDRLPEWSA